MYRLYNDLREKLGEPQWHDEQGVPRYCAYQPSCGGIYDHWSALLEIDCQACGQLFLVSDSYSTLDLIRQKAGATELRQEPVLPTTSDAGWFSFGDAPWHGEEQCSGTTMSTEVLRVVEFWTRDGGPHKMEWRRRPEYEFAYPRQNA